MLRVVRFFGFANFYVWVVGIGCFIPHWRQATRAKWVASAGACAAADNEINENVRRGSRCFARAGSGANPTRVHPAAWPWVRSAITTPYDSWRRSMPLNWDLAASAAIGGGSSKVSRVGMRGAGDGTGPQDGPGKRDRDVPLFFGQIRNAGAPPAIRTRAFAHHWVRGRGKRK